MKKTIFRATLFTFFIVWAAMASALAATYAYRNDTFSYDTPSAAATTVTWHSGTTGATNGAPACTTYPLGDDDWSDITFGSATTPANNFTFTFAGTTYSGVRIYSNGMLVFGTDNSGQWRTFSNASLPYTTTLGTYTSGCSGGQLQNAIIPYWIDIVAGTGNNTANASIKYELLGTAPNRRLVISWVNVKLYNQTARYNFQVSLYESPAGGLNSNFKFQYTTGSSDGSSATVGVQVGTADSTLYSYNQSFIDPNVGSAILWYPANQLAGKSAEYRFDENAWTGATGEVTDTSGNGLNASRNGAATNVGTGYVCRGGSFTANTSNTVLDSVATPIQPASVGSIDFWFKSNVNWNSANAMLFDATQSANQPFYLMKSSNGALRFVVTDSSGTVLPLTTSTHNYALNTWHHIGVSWNLKPGNNQTLLQIFLDGVLVNTSRATSSGSIYGPLTTLDIGDNATSGVTPASGTGNGANGIIDEVNIYGSEINANQAQQDMNATHACRALDHFHIIHNGNAVTCQATQITIEAHDSTHAPVALSGVNLSLSTSTGHGNWVNVTGGAINPITNNGNGSASYVFSNESVVTFGLQDTVAENNVTISAVSGFITTTSGAANVCSSPDYTFNNVCNASLSFADTGFIFANTATGGSISLPSQIAGNSSGTYYLRAVKTNTTTQACEAALSGTRTVDFAYECAGNPSTCASSNLMNVAGNSAAIAISRNDSNAVTTYQPVSLTFDSTGTAPFSFSYGDVGQVRLWARKLPSSDTPLLLTPLSTTSNAFVVKPYDFSFLDTNGNSTIKCMTTNTPNPAAADASGSKFCAAGDTFSATLRARTAAANNPTAPSFGRCDSAGNTGCTAAGEQVMIASTLVAPTGGSAGTLGGTVTVNASNFTANTGSYTFNTLNWSEVGIISLKASNGNYLSNSLPNNASGCSPSGDTCQGTYGLSGNVGRFYPKYFQLAITPQPSCSGFVYGGHVPESGATNVLLGQPFTVQATAMNGLPTATVTQNYQNSLGFAKSINLSLANGGAAGTLYLGSVQTGTNAIPAANFKSVPSPGVGSVAYNDASGKVVSYVFNAFNVTGNLVAPAPTVLTLHADDADTTTSPVTTGDAPTASAKFYAYVGRLRLFNATGSEKLPLQMPVQTQYWSGNTWIQNSADSCTSLPANAFYLSSNLTSVTGPVTISNGGSVAAGTGVIPLAPTAGGVTGSVDIAADLGSSGSDQSCLSAHGGSAANLPWLRSRNGTSNSCTNGTFDRDPSARATFGIYSPESKRIIHTREFFF